MGYKRMSEDERILKEFPGLSQEDLDTVDRLFCEYLIFENVKEGRKIWTSCCHKNGIFLSNQPRTAGPKEYLLLNAKHNERVECPFCQKSVMVKNRKMLRSDDSLREYHAVVFVHVSEDGETVWCQGYWATKEFKSDPAGQPLYLVTRVYCFQKGAALQWERSCWDGKMMPSRLTRERLNEPFSQGGMCARNEAYKVIGYQRLKKSFLRYSWYDVPLYKEEDDLWRYTRQRKDLMRYLGVAARYPENVEMLRKAGMDQPVRDMVYNGKKNAAVLKWGETDPRAAFGLTKTQLKEFLTTSRNMNTLYIYRKLCKAGAEVSFVEAEQLDEWLGLELAGDVLKRARDHHVPARKLLRYLESFAGPRCHGVIVNHDFVARIWCDYIDAAVQLGYDMANPVNQMPRDLDRRHDETAAALRVKVESELAEQAKERFESLQKKYAFEDDGFFIRAPFDAEEIIAEGKTLRHCVGGYAERHAKGATTILFLRQKACPAMPYVTIEMNGAEIRQIHGYKNDCVKGAVSPMVTHKQLLHDWRAWLKAGSKRDKQGAPVMPKERKEKEVTVA